jgi:hypothetical protein
MGDEPLGDDNMRETIPSSELNEIVQRADTLRGAEILLDQEGLRVEAFRDVPGLPRATRIIVGDGPDFRGTVVFIPGARVRRRSRR